LDSGSLEFLPERILSIPRTSTLTALREKIFAEIFQPLLPSPNFPGTPAAIQVSHMVLGHDIFVVEEGGGDTGQEGSIDQLGLFDGAVLYVEKKPAEGQASYLEQRFEMELHMIEVSYNKLGSKVFDQPLGIDKRKTMRDLVAQIGKLLDIPAEEIKVSRNMVSGEFKNLDASIDDCGVFDGCTLFIEKGKPMRKGDVRIGLIRKEGEEKDDYQKLGEYTLREDTPVEEIRKLASEKTEWEHVRLREKRGYRAANIFVDGTTLKGSVMTLKDGSEVIVEKLDQPEHLQKNQILLYIQKFNQQTWEISPRKEFILDKTATIGDVLNLVSEQEKIEAKFIEIAKPIRSHMTDPAIIYGLNWDIDLARILTRSPWYIVDADTLYWRDIREPQNIPQNAILEGKEKEKGLKIFTPYDDDFQDFVMESEEAKKKEPVQENEKEKEVEKSK